MTNPLEAEQRDCDLFQEIPVPAMKWKTTEARNFCSPRLSSEERGRGVRVRVRVRVRIRVRVGVMIRVRVRTRVRDRIRVRVRVRDGVRDKAMFTVWLM
jgi:hypothetical protein